MKTLLFLLLSSLSFAHSSDIFFYANNVYYCEYHPDNTRTCKFITYPELLVEIACHWLEPPIYDGISSGYDLFVFNEVAKHWNPGYIEPELLQETNSDDNSDLETFLEQVEAEITEAELNGFLNMLENWKESE